METSNLEKVCFFRGACVSLGPLSLVCLLALEYRKKLHLRLSFEEAPKDIKSYLDGSNELPACVTRHCGCVLGLFLADKRPS